MVHLQNTVLIDFVLSVRCMYTWIKHSNWGKRHLYIKYCTCIFKFYVKFSILGAVYCILTTLIICMLLMKGSSLIVFPVKRRMMSSRKAWSLSTSGICQCFESTSRTNYLHWSFFTEYCLSVDVRFAIKSTINFTVLSLVICNYLFAVLHQVWSVFLSKHKLVCARVSLQFYV